MNTSDSSSYRRSARWAVRVLVVGAGLVAAALVLIGIYTVLATFVLHGPVNERSLFQSVSNVAGSAFSDVGDPCERVGSSGGEWSCTVGGKSGSGSARYRVTVRADSSCWKGDLVVDQSEDRMPKSISGCVRRLEWSLF
ncbi:MAG: hypothetical protein R2736_17130 [Solirubrobacterales bacterium]|nr:hypothetical protein [Acidimicrobiales bacterium]